MVWHRMPARHRMLADSVRARGAAFLLLLPLEIFLAAGAHPGAPADFDFGLDWAPSGAQWPDRAPVRGPGDGQSPARAVLSVFHAAPSRL